MIQSAAVDVAAAAVVGVVVDAVVVGIGVAFAGLGAAVGGFGRVVGVVASARVAAGFGGVAVGPMQTAAAGVVE